MSKKHKRKNNRKPKITPLYLAKLISYFWAGGFWGTHFGGLIGPDKDIDEDIKQESLWYAIPFALATLFVFGALLFVGIEILISKIF